MDFPSLQQFQEALSAIKNAIEAGKLFLDLGKDPKVKAEAIKFQDELGKAYLTILDMYERCMALAKEKQELEQQLAKLDAWDKEKTSYQAAQLAPGVHARLYTPQTQPAEPPHWACEKCFQERKISKLQAQPQQSQPMLRCYACGAIYYFGRPGIPQGRITR